MLRVLVVEDDDELRESLVLVLRRAGHQVLEANSVAAARPLLANLQLLLTDLRLPDDLGTNLQLEAQRVSPQVQTLVMTGHATIESAIAATRHGARDYLQKPFEIDVLKQQVAEIDTLHALRQQAACSRTGLLGSSAAMQRVFAMIEMAAASSAPVLIEGETGTGKELAARAIHQHSARCDKPMIAVNLAALPTELVDSELFGHERGAFTSAQHRRQGRFALAEGGTLFLDELNSMPLELQPKLLRALETGEIWPVGADRPQAIHVRVIAASNQPLAQLVAQGRVRGDLYYRLNVLPVQMPPLRERVEDIPLLVRSLLDRHDPSATVPSPVEVTADALRWLCAQPWPGNVRELKNLLERALLQSSALQRQPPRLMRSDLDHSPQPLAALPFKEAQSAASDSWTRATITTALQQAGGNRAQAAKQLQMNRTALFKLMKKLNIHD